jgi:hypothetical protein
MGLRDKMMAVVRDVAEGRFDDGAAPKALTLVKNGCASDGRRLLTESGDLLLAEGERVRSRADFKRFGLVVVHPSSATSRTKNVVHDVEKDADVIVTDRRVVIVADDLSTKGGWSGSGLGAIVAVGANVAHAVGSKVRHRGEAAVFEIALADVKRVISPEVSAFDWSKKRSVAICWTEQRNLGPGEMQFVLLDQRGENDHINVARLLSERPQR